MTEIAIATAGWVVSPIIKCVITKTQTYIVNKFFEKAGIEDDMKKIETILTEILSVMGMVEKQRIVDPNQVQLVQEIKDAVYDAEDIMDEIEYHLMKKKSKNQRSMVSWVASSSHAVYKFVVGNDQFNMKVKTVSERLDKAKKSAEILLKLIGNIQQHEGKNPHSTSSLINEKIFGREKEREEIINLLRKEVDNLPTIIPIVGHGGIGKTTLAQIIYNDQRVENHFERMWVSVSDNFNKEKLTRDMLKQASKNLFPMEGSFEMLQNELKNVLANINKNILLVLDDVWYDRMGCEQYSYKKEWLEILAPFKSAKPGSKILLTTRLPLVGSILGSITPVTLDGLNVDDSWSIFKFYAFDHENQHHLLELEHIGREIVNRLKGSALAIRVVGGQLRGNSNVEDWKKVLNDNPVDTSDIMNILHRSYKHLPKHLQRCFAYCSLFPKDYRLKPDRLVHMWIAHGFVHPEERSSSEQVGRTYFTGLLARSFFQVIRHGNKEYYVMHDLMNDLACHVSKGECLMIDEDYSIRNLDYIRHLSVTPKAVDVLKNMHGLDKLHTLMFINFASFSEDTIEEVAFKLKRIRVLDIEWELPTVPNISECKHLRYLSFREPNKMVLPKSFNKLHHLSVLFVRNKYPKGKKRAYYNISLPKFLCGMSSLVLIDISKSFIMDVGEVAQLQNLWRGGSISLHVEKKAHELELLGYINNTKGLLDISGLENVTSRKEAIKAQLSSKEHITRLKLQWLSVSSELRSKEHHEVLEALCPNPQLERLEIYGYPGAVFPFWLESNLFSRIKSINLEACRGLVKLPALGQLPLLQYLFVGSMDVREVGLEFYGTGAFPSLEELKIYDMRSLEKWTSPCGVQAFSKLHKLEIVYCPKFVGLEWDNFPALQKFRICTFDAMLMKAQLMGYGCLLRLTKMEIANCRGIITLEGLHELVSLQRLLINRCPNLSSLPEMKFFYSLEFLAIFGCRKLRSLPKKGLPVSLLLLCIDGTHHDLEEQILRMEGREWDKVIAISGCKLHTSIGKIYPYSGLEWEAEKIFHYEFSIKELGHWNRIWDYKINKDEYATSENKDKYNTLPYWERSNITATV